MFKNKKNAFSLVEVLVVLVLIGVISALLVTVLAGSKKTELRKIAGFASHFYNDVSNSFQGLLAQQTTNYTLENLNDINGDKKIDSYDLAYYFQKNLSGGAISRKIEQPSDQAQQGAASGTAQNSKEQTGASDQVTVSCTDFNLNTKSTAYAYMTGAVCVDFPHIQAAFVYDQTCSKSIQVKEYITEEDVSSIVSSSKFEPASRTVKNLCGYVVYSVQGGEGNFKKDVFTIPFGKRTIK